MDDKCWESEWMMLDFRAFRMRPPGGWLLSHACCAQSSRTNEIRLAPSSRQPTLVDLMPCSIFEVLVRFRCTRGTAREGVAKFLLKQQDDKFITLHWKLESGALKHSD